MEWGRVEGWREPRVRGVHFSGRQRMRKHTPNRKDVVRHTTTAHGIARGIESTSATGRGRGTDTEFPTGMLKRLLECPCLLGCDQSLMSQPA